MLAASLALLLPLAACQGRKARGRAPDPVPVGAYADGPEGLASLWRDILTACQKDDRGRVHDLLASLFMTREELGSLFGAERARALWPRYESLMGSLANVGAIELVAHVYEKKYDDIAVVRVDLLPEGEQQPTDRQIQKALVQKAPLYTVRVKRKAEPLGLRYDFFVYLNGRWRTGNLLGKYL